MNMKKIVVSTLAAATLAASVSVVGVSANTLGVSKLDTSFEVVAGEGATVTVKLDGQKGLPVDVTAEIPADLMEAGTYSFYAEILADVDLEEVFAKSPSIGNNTIDYVDIFEIHFADAEGKSVYVGEGVKLTFSFSKATGYNATFIYQNETDGFVMLDASLKDVAVPHFSRFAIARLTPVESSSQPSTQPSSQPSTQPSTQPSIVTPTSDVKTGDNAGTTAAVFAVMAVVALGTSAFALKTKKSSK